MIQNYQSATSDVLANRRLIDNLPGGLVFVGVDGSIRIANREAARILGLSYDQLTRRYINDFDSETLWEDGSHCPVEDYPVTRALVTGQPQPATIIGVQRADGEISWAVYTAVPIRDPETLALSGAFVTFVDITERRKAESQLRESEARLRSIVESAPNLILTTDAEAKITFINRTPPGHDIKSFMKRYAWEFARPGEADHVKAQFEAVLRTGELRVYEVSGFDGRRYRVHAAPVRVDHKITGISVFAWDVTEQRELEARVRLADRMATIGTLAAGMAHEINNPLTYMLANLQRLKPLVGENHAARSSMQSSLENAIEGAERIRNIVRDLNAFSQIDDGPPVEVDVRKTIESSLRMTQNQILCRARIVEDYGEVPPVLATESRLGQLFLNLLVNAAQAIPEGAVSQHQVTVRTFSEKGMVIVEVADSGHGISAELLEKIFNPFFTTKPPGMGTGLGLYICRSLARSLGGEVSVTSEVGRGSKFRVTLPRAPENISEAKVEKEAVEPSHSRLRVLLVDDEPAILSVLQYYLADHEVSVANNGREALALIAEREFDAIFCDLVMPDLTGVDVYEHVKRTDPNLASRMVFMTGGAYTERSRNFLETVRNRVLEKPFSPEELTAVLTTLS